MNHIQTVFLDSGNDVARILSKCILVDLRSIILKLAEFAENPQKVKLSNRFVKIQNICKFSGLFGVIDFLDEVIDLAKEIENQSVMPKDILVRNIKAMHKSIQEFGAYLKAVENGTTFNPYLLRLSMDELCEINNSSRSGMFVSLFPSIEFKQNYNSDSNINFSEISIKLNAILSGNNAEEMRRASIGISDFFKGSESYQYFYGLESFFSLKIDFTLENINDAWIVVAGDIHNFIEKYLAGDLSLSLLKFDAESMSNLIFLMSESFWVEMQTNSKKNLRCIEISNQFWVPRENSVAPSIYKVFNDASTQMISIWDRESGSGNIVKCAKNLAKISSGASKLNNTCFEDLVASLDAESDRLISEGGVAYDFWLIGAVSLIMLKQLSSDEFVQDEKSEIEITNKLIKSIKDRTYNLDDLPTSPSFNYSIKNGAISAIFKESISIINQAKKIVDDVNLQWKLTGQKASSEGVAKTSGSVIADKLRPLVGVLKLLNLTNASQFVDHLISMALDESTWSNEDDGQEFYMALTSIFIFVERSRSGNIVDFINKNKIDPVSIVSESTFNIHDIASLDSVNNFPGDVDIQNASNNLVKDANKIGHEVLKNENSDDVIETSSDSDLVEIFVKESDALINKSLSFLDKSDANEYQLSFDDATVINRAFHTIKGSGLTSGFNNLSLVAQSGQYMLDKILVNDNVDIFYFEQDSFDIIRSGLTLLQQWINVIKQKNFLEIKISDVTNYISLANNFTFSGSKLSLDGIDNYENLETLLNFSIDDEFEIITLSNKDLQDKLNATYSSESIIDNAQTDQAMSVILINEIQSGINKVENLLELVEGGVGSQESISDLSRVVHGMKGALRTFGLMRAGDLLHILEDDLTNIKIEELDLERTNTYRFAFDIISKKIDDQQFQSSLYKSNTSQVTLLKLVPESKSLPDVKQHEEQGSQLNSGLQVEPKAAQELQVESEPEATLKVEVELQVESEQEVEPKAAQELRVEPQVISKPELALVMPLEPVSPRAKQIPSTASEIVSISTESLLNLSEKAGSAVTLQSRTATELSLIIKSVGELSANIDRLENLINTLSDQAEVQFSSIQVGVGHSNGDFDQFEIDRYTALQEITRAISESLQDVRYTEDALSISIHGLDHTLSQKEYIATQVHRDVGQLMVVNFGSREKKFLSTLRLASRDAKIPEVNFKMIGDAEIPVSIMNKITHSIDHILRNTVAHGIELGPDRIAKSKTKIGNIIMIIKSTVEKITIEIEDDGAGIDVEKVLLKARELGVAGSGSYSDQEIFDMLFAPGLSTSTNVTQLSGRGVGLDSVKSSLQEIGGEIFVYSEAGKGSKFKLEIPMDIIALSVIPIIANGRMTMVPSSIIEKIIPVDLDAAANAAITGSILVDDTRFSYVRFGWLTSEKSAAPMKKQMQLLLCGISSGNPMAFEVDGIEPARKVLIKSLGKMISGISGLIAGTILPDSSVCLIANPTRMKKIGTTKSNNDDGVKSKLAMVVDDSPTVRMATSKFLRRHGFDVIEAIDGIDALECLQNIKPDIIILDVEMPRMGGFELLEKMRADENLKSLMVIIVSSRTAKKHRDHAELFNVSGYLGKPFEESELIAEINACLATFN